LRKAVVQHLDQRCAKQRVIVGNEKSGLGHGPSLPRLARRCICKNAYPAAPGPVRHPGCGPLSPALNRA
jgi:hypothetical protein